MTSHNRMIGILATVITLLGTSTKVQAVDFDFFGDFTQDNDVFQLNFTVESDNFFTIFTSSWDQGGFDPIVAIWESSSGNLIEQQDDGGITGSLTSNGVVYDFGIWDSNFTLFLPAGDYIATIAQFNNFANSGNLANGFSNDGNPNFTAAFGCSNGGFCGVFNANDNRASNYALHIVEVPEPLTLLGVGTAVTFGSVFKRKLGKTQSK